MKSNFYIAIGALLLLSGCTAHPTYSTLGNDGQKSEVDVIKNKKEELSLRIGGVAYYGVLTMEPERRYVLNPLIQSISGNAQGVLKNSAGHLLTCVMDLDTRSLSGSGYCMEEGESKLKRIALVTMD